MTRYRFQHDPVIWVIFAVAVVVPSLEYARLRRAREAAPTPAVVPTSAPRVQPAGAPRLVPPPQAEPAPPRDTTPPERVAATADSARIAPPAPKPIAPPDSSRYLPVGPASTRIAAAARSANGDLAAVLEESGRVTLWNLDLHKQISSFETGLRPAANFSGPPPAMELLSSPGSASPPMLAIGGLDGGVHVWNPVTGTKLFAGDSIGSPMVNRRVLNVVWTGLAELASIRSNFTLTAWRVTSPPDTAPFFVGWSPGGWVRDVDYSMESGVLAVAAMGGLHLRSGFPYQWTLVDTSGAESYDEHRARMRAAAPGEKVLRRWGTYPYKVTFGPGGSLVASVWLDQEIRVHSTGIGRQPGHRHAPGSSNLAPTRVRAMTIPEGWSAWCLAFSPDGKLLAASGINTVYVWSLTPGTEPLAIKVPRGPVHALWFAPHGRSLVVAGYGDTYLREIALPEGW